MSTKLRLTFLLIFILLLGFVNLPNSSAQEPNRVGLVVQFGDGSTATRCISFAGQSITGYEVLHRSGLSILEAFDSLQGAAICKIGGDGCPADDCFCAMPDYWSYWHLQGGSWVYAPSGSSSYQVQNGAVEGWHWSQGNPPSVMTFDQICAPVAPDTPVPTDTPILATDIVVPSDTPVPTDPPVVPSNTPVPPTDLPQPTDNLQPTDTLLPPAATLLPPTATWPPATETPFPVAQVNGIAETPEVTDTPISTATTTPGDDLTPLSPETLESAPPTPTLGAAYPATPTQASPESPAPRRGPTSFLVFGSFLIFLAVGLIFIVVLQRQ